MRFHRRAVILASLVVASAAAGSIPALAAGSEFGTGSAPAASQSTIPNARIKGKPARFRPRRLTVTARWTSPTCTASQESLTITNRESTAETVTIKGTTSHVTIGAHTKEGFCIKKSLAGHTATLGLQSNSRAALHLTIN